MRGYFVLLFIAVLGGLALLGKNLWNEEPSTTVAANAAAGQSSTLADQMQNGYKKMSAPSGSRHHGIDHITDEQEQRYRSISDNEDYPTLRGRINEITTRRPGLDYTPEQLLSVIEQESAWETVHVAPDALPLTDEEKTDGREFIAFNDIKIESLMPGDQLQLPIAGAYGDFEMVVDSIFHNDDRTLTWHGHLKDHPESLIQITQSHSLTIGGIDTPEGEFVLQAHDNAGWIASAATLDKRNYAENDAIDPHDH